MALRHLFPECDLPDFRLPTEPVKAPALPRKPHQVKFRPGADLAKVAGELVGYGYSEVSASVGAGKSTEIPAALHKAYQKPIVHLVPHRLLALDLYAYLKTQDLGAEYGLMRVPSEDFSSGVTITTYACLVAKLIIGRGSKSPLGDVVLYADENHESDAYTYVVGKLGPSIPGIAAYISATATKDCERFPMRETKGKVITRKLPKTPVKEWDPLDNGMPWSITSQTDNLVIFVDNDRSAERLVGIYNGGGATAYRMSAKMDEELFEEAMGRFRDPRSGIIVFVCDYSFRNGFDFSGTGIDSGEVKYYENVNGSTSAKYRMCYELENFQAIGRVGRHEGQDSIFWIPDCQLKKAICMLEGVEMEAAAVLFRILNFSVPAEIRPLALFAGGKTVPANLTSSFNSFIALTAQAAELMTNLVYDRPITPPEEHTAEDVLNSYADSPVEETKDYFRSDAMGESAGAVFRDLDGASYLEELRSVTTAASTLEWPNYYGCHGLAVGAAVLPRYGENWRQAMADVLQSEHIVYSFTSDERKAFVSVFLLHYNVSVAQVAAITRVLRVKTGLMSLASQHPMLVSKWSDWMAAQLRTHEALGKSIIRAVDKLRLDSMHFVSVPPDEKYELELADRMASQLRTVVSKARSAVDSKSIFDAMKTVSAPVEDGVDVRLLTAKGAVEDSSDTLRAMVKPIRVAGKAMHDFTLYADQAVVWTEEDFISGLEQLLNARGFSVSTIRKLTIEGSKVDPGRVIQAVRDRGWAKHRKKQSFTIRMLGGPPAAKD